MNFGEQRALGRTGLKVGRLGIASGYKAPAAAIEAAFERGCNYFTWGTVIMGYAPGMRVEESVCDIASFDPGAYAADLARAEAQGSPEMAEFARVLGPRLAERTAAAEAALRVPTPAPASPLPVAPPAPPAAAAEAEGRSGGG